MEGDFKTGCYRVEQRIKEDAEPIDDVTKFAWLPEDIEEVTVWHEYDESELAFRQELKESAELNETIKRQEKMLAALQDAFVEELVESDKVGQLFRVIRLGKAEISREYVPDPSYTDEADGSYLKPHRYVLGMEVSEGKWYWLDDVELPHEAIATGVPGGFYDRSFFDFVEGF